MKLCNNLENYRIVPEFHRIIPVPEFHKALQFGRSVDLNRKDKNESIIYVVRRWKSTNLERCCVSHVDSYMSFPPKTEHTHILLGPENLIKTHIYRDA